MKWRLQPSRTFVPFDDDDTAFMQLVLSNAQGELSALERGMHALAATQKNSKAGKSAVAYARAVGVEPSRLAVWIEAAEVYQHSERSECSATDFGNRTTHLRAVHAAPRACWRAIVERMVQGGWSHDQTIAAVRAVNAVRPPRGYEKLFAVEKLQDSHD